MRYTYLSLLSLLLLFTACTPPQKEAPKQSTEETRQEILGLIKGFSAAVVAGNTDAIADAYTADAKIFPGGTDIITGRSAIHTYWLPDSNSSYTHHAIYPEEITIQDTTAYDYGYYEVSGINGENSWGPYRGKYIIVWKKVPKEGWKIHLDMWNKAK